MVPCVRVLYVLCFPSFCALWIDSEKSSLRSRTWSRELSKLHRHIPTAASTKSISHNLPCASRSLIRTLPPETYWLLGPSQNTTLHLNVPRGTKTSSGVGGIYGSAAYDGLVISGTRTWKLLGCTAFALHQSAQQNEWRLQNRTYSPISGMRCTQMNEVRLHSCVSCIHRLRAVIGLIIAASAQHSDHSPQHKTGTVLCETPWT